MFKPAIHRHDKAAYFRNRARRSQTMQNTPENAALVAEYEKLAAEINLIPARIAGLRMNYKKRELPQALAALAVERDEKVTRLLVLEQAIFHHNACE
jgi:hypothetical protein